MLAPCQGLVSQRWHMGPFPSSRASPYRSDGTIQGSWSVLHLTFNPQSTSREKSRRAFWWWLLNYNRKSFPQHLEASSCTGSNNFRAGVLGSWWRQGHFFLLSGMLITIHLLLWGMITCQGSFEPLASWTLSQPPPDCLDGH